MGLLAGVGDFGLTGLVGQAQDALAETIEAKEAVVGPTNSLTTRVAALEALMSHVPMDITSFTNSIGTVEKGTVVSSITFTWARNKVPASLAINQGIGAITPPDLLTVTKTVNITQSIAFTLTASDGTSYDGNTDTAQTTVNVLSKMRWGAVSGTSLNSAGILALVSSDFATGRGRTVTINAGSGLRPAIVYPAAWGDAAFTIGGLSNNDFTKSVVSFTNSLGFTENVNVYIMNNVQFGNLTIVIS